MKFYSITIRKKTGHYCSTLIMCIIINITSIYHVLSNHSHHWLDPQWSLAHATNVCRHATTVAIKVHDVSPSFSVEEQALASFSVRCLGRGNRRENGRLPWRLWPLVAGAVSPMVVMMRLNNGVEQFDIVPWWPRGWWVIEHYICWWRLVMMKHGYEQCLFMAISWFKTKAGLNNPTRVT